MAEQKHWWIKRCFSSIYLSLWLLVWALTNWLIVALYLMTDLPPCTCCYMFLFFPLAFTFFNSKITLPLLINIGKKPYFNAYHIRGKKASHKCASSRCSMSETSGRVLGRPGRQKPLHAARLSCLDVAPSLFPQREGPRAWDRASAG